MTDSKEATCKHCGGKLLVYSTRHTETCKVQYLRCKTCKRNAPTKRTKSDLASRVAEIEKKLADILGDVVHN